MIVSLVLMGMGGLLAGLMSHPFGVAPILGAMLCASCFLRPRDLWIVGLGGIAIRDLLLGPSAFTLVRLVGVALVIGVILALKVRLTWRSVVTGLLIVAPIFHLVLAAGDWATGTCAGYPRTWDGLGRTVASAAPYFQQSFLTDLAFTGLFFGIAWLITAVAAERRPMPAASRG